MPVSKLGRRGKKKLFDISHIERASITGRNAWKAALPDSCNYKDRGIYMEL
jgi:hypothetical protein